jgi:hypothetical protein
VLEAVFEVAVIVLVDLRVDDHGVVEFRFADERGVTLKRKGAGR